MSSVDLAAIVLALSGGAAVAPVLEILRTWLTARKGRGTTVEVTIGGDAIKLSGLDDPAQAEQFINTWLSRHSEGRREAAE